MRLLDGLTNVFNQLVNRRSALSQNRITRAEITQDDLRHIYLTGIGSKIVRLKAGYALDGTVQFASEEQELIYKKKLAKHVKKAARFMVGFGRGCIVLHAKGDNLSQPLTAKSDDLIVQVFSGDMVTVGDVSRDLSSSRYMKPMAYNIRGHAIHHSRVIDFTYVEPSEFDLPVYRYGGVSEFELIYPQLVNDAVVERSSASMLERSSSWVYKVKGLKDAMASKNDSAMVAYFSRVEDMRGIYGAAIIDADDSAEAISQSLTNLAETDQISLRRLAMVTGIPLAVLVGESVRGLNATGDNEQKMFQDMIETLQSDYLEEPLQQLFRIYGLEGEFKENQGGTPESRMEFETKAIANAKSLYEMGEDHAWYLDQYDVKKPDDFAEMWAEAEEQDKQEIVDEAKFEENKHPRGEDGKFGSGGGEEDNEPTEKSKQEKLSKGKFFLKDPTEITKEDWEKVNDHLERTDYQKIGLRAIPKEQDVFEGDDVPDSWRVEDGTVTEERLEGASAIDLKFDGYGVDFVRYMKALKELESTYAEKGATIAIIGTKSPDTYEGNDPGEVVMPESEMIFAMGVGRK